MLVFYFIYLFILLHNRVSVENLIFGLGVQVGTSNTACYGLGMCHNENMKV